MSNPVSNTVLREILEKTNASTGMFVQKIYKDTLRNLINIFGNCHYIDRNNNSIKVKCFHANQERSVAKSTLGDNITLPVITIGENNTSNSDDRRRYTPILIHDKYWHKRKNRAIRILSMASRPVDIRYTINIWSKYKEDLDQLREYIFTLFNPDLEVKTKQSNITKAFLESEAEVQQSEADDQQDRVLKKSITIKVETYIENPKFLYTSTGKIERINYELALMDTNVSETLQVGTSIPHSTECFCSECIMPVYLITGNEYDLAISCAVGVNHGSGCACAECTLAISLISGESYNIPVNCEGIGTVDELE